MSQKKKNPVWAFFASVKLALFLLFILAATSIIGTIIPQSKPMDFYVHEYGENMARLMQTLGIPDMYNSWWFLGLLTFFSLNLIVCSLERIPTVWKIIHKDNLDIDPAKLVRRKIKKEVTLRSKKDEVVSKVASFLKSKGWKPEQRDKGDGVLLFAEKGPWTRFGVYIVHTSILIIFIGAIIGSPTVARKIFKNPTFAFKGSIMIPETRQTDSIFAFDTGEKIPLGFTIRCNYFNIEYYPNGMPKEYLSDLTVIEDGREVLHTRIEVNSPLTYRGITFYQSSYQPYNDFVVRVKSEKTGATYASVIPPAKQIRWDEGGITFGILNTERFGEVVRRIKVWFSEHQGEPSIFWIEAGREAIIERPSGKYAFTAKQLYATGLQVAKDPGVWFVYIGCGMMLLGLMVAFFMSHRKIWAYVREEDGAIRILFVGSANKNKLGFEKKFHEMLDDFS